MSRRIESTRRSNHSIFLPQNYGSPFNDTAEHISRLGMGRLDFERGAVAGEVIYTIEGDLTPTSQQEEEARIATLAYALKKLGNPEDAAEFMRCLNEISKEGDARYRQVVASYYYGEIAERGLGVALKEMALIAMHLASLNPVTEEIESDIGIVYAPWEASNPRSSSGREVASAWIGGFDDTKHNGASLKEYKKTSAHRLLFDLEIATVKRMVRGRRKSARFAHDDMTEWLNDLESNGATIDELDDAFAHVEALDQYDEGGVIVRMSAHERAVTCGRVDPEFSAEDLPECVQYLAGVLRRVYAAGVAIDKIWEEINADLEIIFPVSVNLDLPKDCFPSNLTTGRVQRIVIYRQPKFVSHANRELQQFTRQALEAILLECEQDFHMTAQRHNRSYRKFYARIRRATDTKRVSELIMRAYDARQKGRLSVKHFIALNAAADIQRERLLSRPLSADAYKLIEEIVTASEKKLRYLAWAMYGDNEPYHPIHTLDSQEQTRTWEVMTAAKAAILLPRLYAKLIATWGRELPLACFIFLVVFKEFFEMPRLRKALRIVLNKRRVSVRRDSSAPKPPDPRPRQSAKRTAAARLRTQAASSSR
jgi:uncharacterized membrane protein